MAQTSFALLTNTGRAKEAAALANATTIEITHIAIGDGATVPSGGETQLYHEVARKTISGHGTVTGAENVAYFDCYLAADDGPFTIREAGLFDSEGDLIAISHYDPPISKPVPASGQTVEGTVRLEVAFSNIATVVIKVDPAMQVALQRLTQLPWIAVMEMGRNDPPGAPVPGDVYVIGGAPTGTWAGHAGKVAEYTLAGWALLAPRDGHGVGLPDGRVFERVGGVYVEKIALDVQSGKWLWGGAAGGTADALTISLTPAPASWDALVGAEWRLKVSTINTGPVTININGRGAKDVVRSDGSPLAPGDLVPGRIIAMVFDGTNAVVVAGILPMSSEIVQNSPIYPEIVGGGRFTITAAAGVVTVDAGQKWIHRGLKVYSTDDFVASTGENDSRALATAANKTYHLVWHAPGTGDAVPIETYPNGRFALVDLTGASPTETSQIYDTTYDRMLCAKVVTNGGNVPTVTALLNRTKMSARGSKGSLEVSASSSVWSNKLSGALNWSRTPECSIEYFSADATSGTEAVNMAIAGADRYAYEARCNAYIVNGGYISGAIGMWARA